MGRLSLRTRLTSAFLVVGLIGGIVGLVGYRGIGKAEHGKVVALIESG